MPTEETGLANVYAARLTPAAEPVDQAGDLGDSPEPPPPIRMRGPAVIRDRRAAAR